MTIRVRIIQLFYTTTTHFDSNLDDQESSPKWKAGYRNLKESISNID